MFATRTQIKTLLQLVRGKIRQLPLKKRLKNLLLEDIDLAIKCFDEGDVLCALNSVAVIVDKIHTRLKLCGLTVCIVGPLLNDIHLLQQMLIEIPVPGVPGPPGIPGAPGAPGVSSLVFNALQINRGNNSNPDDLALNTQITLEAWIFANNASNPLTEAVQLSFNVPSTYPAQGASPRFIVHFVTEFIQPEPVSGNALFTLQTRFTPPTPPPPTNTIRLPLTNADSPAPIVVESAPLADEYNHYILTYIPNGTIRPNDHVLLNIIRDYSITNDFDGRLDVVTVEFTW